MPYFFIRSFEKTLLPSMIAAFASGPKQGMPALCVERINTAQNKGIIGSNNCIFNAFLYREVNDFFDIGGSDGNAFGIGGYSAVSGKSIYF